MAKVIGKRNQFDDFYNHNIYENYEVVDKFSIYSLGEISKYKDLDFVNAIDIIADEQVGLGYFSTYCFLVQDRTITVYINEEKKKRNYNYDRNEFIQALENEFNNPYLKQPY